MYVSPYDIDFFFARWVDFNIYFSIPSPSWYQPIHHPSPITPAAAAAVSDYILLPDARDWSAVLIASPHPHPDISFLYDLQHTCIIITT